MKKFSLSSSMISTSFRRRSKRSNSSAVVAPAKPPPRITIRVGVATLTFLRHFLDPIEAAQPPLAGNQPAKKGSSRARKACRARCKRVFTTATETPSNCAVCPVLSSSMSRSSNTVRYASGNRLMHART